MSKRVSLSSFSKLIRLDYSLFSALGVLLSGVLAGDLSFHFDFLVAFLIVFFSAVGSFAFNDYLDFEVDVRNNRVDRPLVLGLMSRWAAMWIGVISIVGVFLLSLLLNALARYLVYLSLPLFYLYSLGGKRVLLLKNVVIAGAYVVTILLGSLISDSHVEPIIIYFATMGFIVGLASEIMQDIMDVEGDGSIGIETLSTRFGVARAAWVSVLLYVVIMVLDPLPFFLMIDRRLYFDRLFLLLILAPVASYVWISRSLLREQTPKRIQDLKGRIFLTMQAGCVAYLVGVLF